MPLTETKVCELCGEVFARAENVSKGQWAGRRFCSRKCGSSAVALEKNGALRDFCHCGCGYMARLGTNYITGHAPGKRKRFRHGGTAEERFKKRVTLGVGGCWEYSGYRRKGYGKFGVSPSVSVLAHRFAYELWVGPIPDGLVVHHGCENPACVRPDHLVLKSNEEHSYDHTHARGFVENQYGIWPVRTAA